MYIYRERERERDIITFSTRQIPPGRSEGPLRQRGTGAPGLTYYLRIISSSVSSSSSSMFMIVMCCY